MNFKGEKLNDNGSKFLHLTVKWNPNWFEVEFDCSLDFQWIFRNAHKLEHFICELKQCCLLWFPLVSILDYLLCEFVGRHVWNKLQWRKLNFRTWICFWSRIKNKPDRQKKRKKHVMKQQRPGKTLLGGCSNRSLGSASLYITLPHATVIDVSLDITSYHGGELVLFSRTVSWRMLIRHTSILTGIFRPITIL